MPYYRPDHVSGGGFFYRWHNSVNVDSGDQNAFNALLNIVFYRVVLRQALFFNLMNKGAQDAAKASGKDLVIFNSNDNPVERR
jgi:DNA-binding LacI/PurR family transcriptional regulator